MRTLAFIFAAAVGLAVIAPGPVMAGTRITCACGSGKDKSWIHYNRACEVHFKKKHTRLGGNPKPEDVCSHQEWAQFRAYLCVQAGCTYPYIKASQDKVPVSAP